VISFKKTRGKRYDKDEKSLILDKAIAEIKEGGQITKIADKLGVTFFTLKSWLKEKGVGKESSPKVVKRGRGRPSSNTSKTTSQSSSSNPSPKIKQVTGAVRKGSDVKPEYIRELEKKIEELVQKTKRLSHLYGELRSEVGIDEK
jgi:predicted transcriptional regulator